MSQATHESVQAVAYDHFPAAIDAVLPAFEAVKDELGHFAQLIFDEIRHGDGTSEFRATIIYTLDNEKRQCVMGLAELMVYRLTGFLPPFEPLTEAP